MPQWGESLLTSLTMPFVGEGWHLTLGLLFMLIVIFLPGGVMEGLQRIKDSIMNKKNIEESEATAKESSDG